jgi:hypothetical protein
MRVRSLCSLLAAAALTYGCAQSTTASAPTAAPKLQARATGIGYPTPAAALEALRAKPGVDVATRDGWTIVSDPGEKTVWSFTPASHPAYPAVVKRMVVTTPEAIGIRTSVLCGAAPEACTHLVDEFKKLNERMREALEATAGEMSI